MISTLGSLLYLYALRGFNIRDNTLSLYILWSRHQGRCSIFINSLVPTSGPTLYFYTLLGFNIRDNTLYHYTFFSLAIRSKCPIFVHSLVSKSEPLLYLHTLFGLNIRVTVLSLYFLWFCQQVHHYIVIDSHSLVLGKNIQLIYDFAP